MLSKFRRGGIRKTLTPHETIKIGTKTYDEELYQFNANYFWGVYVNGNVACRLFI
jgi:hypothetical protein